MRAPSRQRVWSDVMPAHRGRQRLPHALVVATPSGYLDFRTHITYSARRDASRLRRGTGCVFFRPANARTSSSFSLSSPLTNSPEAQLVFDIHIVDTILLSSAFPRRQGVPCISHPLSSSCHTERRLHATTLPHISYAARPPLCRVSSCSQPPERLCAGVCHTLRGAQHSA